MSTPLVSASQTSTSTYSSSVVSQSDNLPHQSPTSFEPSSNNVVDILAQSPSFQATLALLETGQRMKDQANELLYSSSGELDAKTMALYTEANEQGNQTITVASNAQESQHQTMNTLVRNVG